MPRKKPQRDLPALLRGQGPVPVAHLRAQLGISPATLSREMHAARSEVLRLGSGRATHYGLAAGYRGLPSRLPVFRIGASGSTATVAELVLLSGGSWLQPTSGGGSRFDGLPPFIQDMAPAGYLGRHFARYHADLALPDRLQDWHDRHRLLAIARRGSDCPGDLVVGEQAMDRYLGESKGVYGLDDFPELAQRAGVGSAGSSAAGEQPKFAYFDGHRHLLVKFTPGDDSPTDQRWRDLLVCEALASETLTEHGITAAATEVIDLENRRYLQVERFDRTRAGRVGVLSLGALDDEYFAERDDWSSAAQRLHAAGMLSAQDALRVKLVEAFAAAISNGDRHFGNLALFCDQLDPQAGCSLAPVYDMLPMDLAPSGGVVPPPKLGQPRRTARLLDVQGEANRLAREFFVRVAEDRRISQPMRDAAERAQGTSS